MRTQPKSITRLIALFLAFSLIQVLPAANAVDLSVPTLTEFVTNQPVTFTKGTSARYGKFKNQSVRSSLFDSIDLLYAEFESVNLEGSTFQNVNFRSAVIGESSLKNAQFNASTFNTQIVATDLTGADFSTSSGGIYFRITLGQGANFSNLDLGSSTFRGADLRNAIFRKATANWAVFDDADLTGADLTDTSFEFSSWKNVKCPNGVIQSKKCDIPISSMSTVKTSTTTTLAKKKTTIYCKKNRTVKKVTAVSPKCPRGFKKTSKPVVAKPRVTVPPTPVAKSRTAACVALRTAYNQGSRTSNAHTFEATMNGAVNVLRNVRWDSTADSVVRFTLQGLWQAALGGIASYLRAYNCA
jgi:uncharacterized protein YjbI with pentapeptide repeats